MSLIVRGDEPRADPCAGATHSEGRAGLNTGWPPIAEGERLPDSTLSEVCSESVDHGRCLVGSIDGAVEVEQLGLGADPAAVDMLAP